MKNKIIEAKPGLLHFNNVSLSHVISTLIRDGEEGSLPMLELETLYFFINNLPVCFSDHFFKLRERMRNFIEIRAWEGEFSERTSQFYQDLNAYFFLLPHDYIVNGQYSFGVYH